MTNFVSRATSLLAGTAPINITAPSLQLPQAVQQSWGGYSPWFPVQVYVPPPAGCSVVQANLLQRHGARFPTTSTGEAIEASVKKLQQATSFDSPDLEFVKDYNYTLGTEDLVQFGAQQSFDSGEAVFERYTALLNETSLPFVRSTESGRVIESALNWTAGIAYASNQECEPALNLIISELGNDTLNANGCPKAGDSTDEVSAWVNVFAPTIVKRINSEAPGANLSNGDIVYLMSLCAFDTVVYERPSRWCYPFTLDEWASYLYSVDLGYYYYTGPGQKYGPVQGVGYVNELLARLTGQSVQDETQTNHTLDDNPATFPLNRTFYADFTHDTLMTAVFGAIGLFEQPGNLPTTYIEEGRSYISSYLVPFAGRMITEKISCNGNGYEPQGTYVRILVNNAVQPLAFCNASLYGLCTLSDFIESQSFARTNGDGLWAECFAT